jgi:hypothetical protein
VDHQLGIDRRSADRAVVGLQIPAYALIDEDIDLPQQVSAGT